MPAIDRRHASPRKPRRIDCQPATASESRSTQAAHCDAARGHDPLPESAKSSRGDQSTTARRSTSGALERQRAFERDGGLTAPVAQLADSYVRMHLNRVFRAEQNLHEVVIYDFRAQLYTRQLSALSALGRKEEPRRLATRRRRRGALTCARFYARSRKSLQTSNSPAWSRTSRRGERARALICRLQTVLPPPALFCQPGIADRTDVDGPRRSPADELPHDRYRHQHCSSPQANL